MIWTTDIPTKAGYYFAVESGSGVAGRERVVSLVCVYPIGVVNESYGLTWCGLGSTKFGRMSDVDQWFGPLEHPAAPRVTVWDEIDRLHELAKAKRRWSIVWR